MNLVAIISYAYIAFFVFLSYYAIAWIYIRIGRYILDYILVPAFSPLVFFNWNYLRKNSEFGSNKNHIAIVLCNNYMPERILSYREDLPKLIKFFKKKNWSYKIYFKADKKELRKIIDNPYATIIYILGHGQRHGVKVNPKELVYYCEFYKSPKKKFIAQLHCNHYGGKSLAEYVSDKSIKHFVTDQKISGIGISKFIDKVTKGKVHGAP